jgi:Flp pilus assembly protein TadD
LSAATLYPSQKQPTDTVPDGPQLIHQGQLEEALQVYLRAVEASPKSAAASNGAGVVLDLMGRYVEARKYFAQAIKEAGKPFDKALAQRAMAISYGFAADCRGAEKYDRAAYEFFQTSSDFYDAGEVANELGRMCLGSGDIDTAYNWYRKGHDAGLQEEHISPAHVDLWNYRWAHARARIAARRGKPGDAAKYIAAAKDILDKGTNPDQQVYLPYLAGYVAFYGGNYSGALADLRNASQTDPFIQCLMAQCYEKLGDTTNALIYYRQAAASTAHSVPAALARPLASRKLQAIEASPH